MTDCNRGNDNAVITQFRMSAREEGRGGNDGERGGSELAEIGGAGGIGPR